MAAGVPCTRCRQRRVKCDRRLPGCVRCEKLSQPCSGYNRLRGFMDEGASLRKRFPVPTPPIESPGGTMERTVPVAHDNSPPPRPPGRVSAAPTPREVAAFDGAGKLSDQATFLSPKTLVASTIIADDMPESEFNSIFFDIDPQAYYAEGANCCGFIPNMSSTVDIDDPQGPTLSWHDYITLESFPQSSVEGAISESTGTASVADSTDEAEAETSHLIRYFAENISPSLDIFDVDRYFGHTVPVKTIRSVLLTSSVAAIASKHFGKITREGGISKNDSVASPLDQYRALDHIDWFYKAAGFYDKAIGRMLLLLQDLRDGNSTTVPETESRASAESPAAITAVGSPSAPLSFKRRRLLNPERKTDDLLAAISIFLLYESLDHRQVEMLHHMSGTQYLLAFDINQYMGSTREQASSEQPTFIGSKAWQASFWNFASVDYTVAYTEKIFPRLDIGDFHMWNAAGLPLREVEGTPIPESLCGPATNTTQMTETIACRTLIWIVLKALGHVAAEKDKYTADVAYSASRCHPLLGPRCWNQIRQHLDRWTELLPDTFEPCLRIPHQPQDSLADNKSDGTPGTSRSDPGRTGQTPSSELYYSNPMCATAVGLYHFVQIILLLHQPLNHDSLESHARFVAKRLTTYRQLPEQIDAHSREISAISRGRPSAAVRMHMIEPIHLAGLCTESPDERLAMAGLLVDIQRDTGFSTEWSVAGLREGLV